MTELLRYMLDRSFIYLSLLKPVGKLVEIEIQVELTVPCCCVMQINGKSHFLRLSNLTEEPKKVLRTVCFP